MHAKSLQSCPTLCNPMDYSPPGSSVHRILQARILEWCLCLPPGDLPNPEIKTSSLTSPALEDGFLNTSHYLRSPDMDIIYPYLYPYLYFSTYLCLLCLCPYILHTHIHRYRDMDI